MELIESDAEKELIKYLFLYTLTDENDRALVISELSKVGEPISGIDNGYKIIVTSNLDKVIKYFTKVLKAMEPKGIIRFSIFEYNKYVNMVKHGNESQNY